MPSNNIASLEGSWRLEEIWREAIGETFRSDKYGRARRGLSAVKDFLDDLLSCSDCFGGNSEAIMRARTMAFGITHKMRHLIQDAELSGKDMNLAILISDAGLETEANGDFDSSDGEDLVASICDVCGIKRRHFWSSIVSDIPSLGNMNSAKIRVTVDDYISAEDAISVVRAIIWDLAEDLAPTDVSKSYVMKLLPYVDNFACWLRAAYRIGFNTASDTSFMVDGVVIPSNFVTTYHEEFMKSLAAWIAGKMILEGSK